MFCLVNEAVSSDLFMDGSPLSTYSIPTFCFLFPSLLFCPSFFFFTVLQDIIKSPVFHHVILFSSPLSALLLYPLICSNLHPLYILPSEPKEPVQRNQH